jgi:hypothetical protein
MRKRPGGRLLTGAAAAAAAVALGLGTTPLLASTASTWTVKPGGKFSAANTGRITVRDATTGTVVTCTPSSLAGQFKSGSGLPDAKIASVTKFSFGSCTGPAGITFTLKTGRFPYHLNVQSYAAASGKTTATIAGFVGAWSGFGCTMTIGGTTAASPGKVDIKYTNSTHELRIVTNGSTLHFYNVGAGCLGLWNTGDRMTISGTYTVTPAQTITSP